MLTRHNRPLADRLAARSLAMALVDPTAPVDAQADALVQLAGTRRAALEQALRRVEAGRFHTPNRIAREAADALRLAFRRVARQPGGARPRTAEG